MRPTCLPLCPTNYKLHRKLIATRLFHRMLQLYEDLSRKFTVRVEGDDVYKVLLTGHSPQQVLGEW